MVVPRSRRPWSDAAHLQPADGVERRRRLVEEDDGRVAEQRDGQAEPLLHALGVAADAIAAAVADAGRLQGGVDLRTPTSARGRPASRQWAASTSRPLSQAW